jgi:hypothetical protein
LTARFTKFNIVENVWNKNNKKNLLNKKTKINPLFKNIKIREWTPLDQEFRLLASSRKIKS